MTTAPTTTSPTPEDLVATVAPVLRAGAAAAEAGRRLTPEAAAALIDAGAFRTWVPRAYGGLEMAPADGLRLFEALSRVDSAAGWVVGTCSVGAYVSQIFPEDGAAEVFTDPRAVLAGAFNPPGAAFPVEGGYRVSGKWPFATGCNYATWGAGVCLVMDGETPQMGPDGRPVLLAVGFPMAEAEIVDTWHTLGMRGTGSHDIRITDTFVPARRTFIMSPWDHPGSAFAGPLYRLGPWLLACQVAVTGLGIAQAAVDDLLSLAAVKTPSYIQTGLADKPVVQDRVARAQALVQAGRNTIYSAIAEAWAFVQDGMRLSPAEGIPVGLAATFGLDAAVQAVELVHAVAGTTAIRNEHRFQQYFRDVHTVSQHAFTSTSRYESLGKLLLGRESDWAFHYL